MVCSAIPPRVITLIVSPRKLRTRIEVSMESGIDMQTIIVLRKLPRNSRIITPVRPAAITASRTTPFTEARTKMDWSNSGVMCRDFGNPARMEGSLFFTSLTNESVEVCPFFNAVSNAPRVPSWRTIFV